MAAGDTFLNDRPSGTAVPGGACQWPSGPVVAPAVVRPAARPGAVSGVGVRNRRDRVTAASRVSMGSGPTAASTLACHWSRYVAGSGRFIWHVLVDLFDRLWRIEALTSNYASLRYLGIVRMFGYRAI